MFLEARFVCCTRLHSYNQLEVRLVSAQLRSKRALERMLLAFPTPRNLHHTTAWTAR